MIYISKIWIRILKLLLVCFLSLVILILFWPQYFIRNLDEIIERKISESIQGDLFFDDMEGDLINGFVMKNIQCNYNDSIKFFAREIYVKPQLSSLVFGELIITNIVIKNADIKYDALSMDIFNLNKDTYTRNIEMPSIRVLKSSIVYGDQLYNIHGHFSLTYDQELYIQFHDFIINSHYFNSELIITSGSISYLLNQLTINNINLKSKWINGVVDCSININNYSKSISNIDIDMIHLYIRDGKELMINNFTIYMDKSLDLMIDKISYLNLEISDFQIDADIYNNALVANYSFRYIDNYYENDGAVNFDTLNWEAVVNFNDFEIDNKTKLSGKLMAIGSYHLDSINVSIDLQNSLVDSKRFNSIFGQLNFTSDKDSNGEIEIESKMKLEYCIFSSYLCFYFNFFKWHL